MTTTFTGLRSGHDSVDTGFLLALANPRDNLYWRALAWTDALNEPLLVTEYVLWEFVNALSPPRRRPKAHSAIANIYADPTYEVVPASPRLFEGGLALHAARPDKDWSLTDCISFLIMEERKITRALAHDRHFEQAGFEALLRRDPP